MKNGRLPDCASALNYASGAYAGQPTKIVPPSANQLYGKTPEQGFAAEWQNYLENALRGQVARSANLPIFNFTHFFPSDNSFPGSQSAAATWHAQYVRSVGATIWFDAATASNIMYAPDDMATNAGPLWTQSIDAGTTFTPKDFALRDGASDTLFFGGSCTTATRSLRYINFGAGGSPTDPGVQTLSGAIECIYTDPFDQTIYAALSSTNRDIVKIAPAAFNYTTLGTRGSGATSPANMILGGYNGALFLAARGVAASFSYCLSGAYSTWTTRSVSSGYMLDARYSAEAGGYLWLTTSGLYFSPSLTGTITLVNGFDTPSVYTAAPANVVGVLHPTGFAVAVASGGGATKRIEIRAELATADQTLSKFVGLGNLGTANTSVSNLWFDGVSLWAGKFIGAGTRSIMRTARAH